MLVRTLLESMGFKIDVIGDGKGIKQASLRKTFRQIEKRTKIKSNLIND